MEHNVIINIVSRIRVGEGGGGTEGLVVVSVIAPCSRIIVICYEKTDHLGYFIKIEFCAWIDDSSMCAESNGASFTKKD